MSKIFLTSIFYLNSVVDSWSALGGKLVAPYFVLDILLVFVIITNIKRMGSCLVSYFYVEPDKKKKSSFCSEAPESRLPIL